MLIMTAALAGSDVRDIAQLCQQLDKGCGCNLLEVKPLVAFHEMDSGPVNVVERQKSLVTENREVLQSEIRMQIFVKLGLRTHESSDGPANRRVVLQTEN